MARLWHSVYVGPEVTAKLRISPVACWECTNTKNYRNHRICYKYIF